MNELIEYILKRIEDGAGCEELEVELRIIQKLIKHIPSYNMAEALADLAGGETDAE